ncbi:ATP-dependent DNA helicase SGS1 [Sugiyamaella lignohabitans]|uniref:DNA 3'-5' helicase n=1 Tax=Sugiyamaella lignohabitans TaxID=796027 RepID=A0A167CYR1_9ASCO|nr:ATP-dependent DNA helicase SGS1 [Sugiyamaella lignohabitans]ANB12266.1 ATP-dependent DNA helicase SGS1 [Sugiyamaella lignohabitans]
MTTLERSSDPQTRSQGLASPNKSISEAYRPTDASLTKSAAQHQDKQNMVSHAHEETPGSVGNVGSFADVPEEIEFDSINESHGESMNCDAVAGSTSKYFSATTNNNEESIKSSTPVTNGFPTTGNTSIQTFKTTVEKFKSTPSTSAPFEILKPSSTFLSTPIQDGAIAQVPGTISPKRPVSGHKFSQTPAGTASKKLAFLTPDVVQETPNSSQSQSNRQTSSQSNTKRPGPWTFSGSQTDTVQLEAIIGYQSHIIKNLTNQLNLAMAQVDRLCDKDTDLHKFNEEIHELSMELEGTQSRLLNIQAERDSLLQMANESICMSPERDRKKRRLGSEDVDMNDQHVLNSQYKEFNEGNDEIIMLSSDDDSKMDNMTDDRRDDIETSDSEFIRDIDAISKEKQVQQNSVMDYFDADDDSDFDISEIQIPPSSPGNKIMTNLSQYQNDYDSADDVEILEYNPYAVVQAEADGPADPSQPATQANKNLPKYPWSNDVVNTLKSTFRLSGFRQNQLEAINATLNGSDVLVLMPTGGGKSLCFQLPALVKSGKTTGVSVVVSPLLSLMQDQVEQLKEKGVKAEMINSQLSADDKRLNRNLLFGNQLDLVYVSPELIRSDGMLNGLKRLHSKGQIARIVIDEAHCVSSWGHDFRPQYKELEFMKEEFPDVPIIALTATATSLVKADIRRCLRSNCLEFKQTFNRPNLSYQMWRAKEKNSVYNSMKDIMDKYRGKTGIIYCRTQSQCEDLAKKLKKDGYRVDYYHGGLDTESRIRVQQQWQSGRIQAVCATVAFGMGIDKPDVRYVIHASMPRTMEGYYQETGRAGRDGNPSECIMFYSFQDFMALMCAIDRDKDLTFQRRNHQKELVSSMMQYCENEIDCRRLMILSYFNETLPKGDICKKTCDNCRDRALKNIVTSDITPIAKELVALVSYVQGDKVTAGHIISVYRGSRIEKIVKLGHDRAPAFGNGKPLQQHDLERIISHLLRRGILKDIPKETAMRNAIATIHKGPNGDAVLRGQIKVEMQFVTTSGRSGSTATKTKSKSTASASKSRQSPNYDTQDDV